MCYLKLSFSYFACKRQISSRERGPETPGSRGGDAHVRGRARQGQGPHAAQRAGAPRRRLARTFRSFWKTKVSWLLFLHKPWDAPSSRHRSAAWTMAQPRRVRPQEGACAPASGDSFHSGGRSPWLVASRLTRRLMLPAAPSASVCLSLTSRSRHRSRVRLLSQ